MPDAVGSGDADSCGDTHFRSVEASLKILNHVKTYFDVGMENVMHVADNVIESGEKNDNHMQKLREVMKNFVTLERDLDDFVSSTKDIMAEATTEDLENEQLEKLLEAKVAKARKKHTGNQIFQHPKFIELNDKLSESCDTEPPTATGEEGSTMVNKVSSSSAKQGGDLEMTQEDLNTKCPYTGTEMKDPVRNTICKHAYDRAGIMHHIQQRRGRALCPVGGCKNKQAITPSHLEDYKEMRRFIQKKRQART